MLQELSPMTPFHIKLYYLLTEKNTGVGQSSHFAYSGGSGSHHHHSGGGANRQHYGGGAHGGGKHNHNQKHNNTNKMLTQGGIGPLGSGMYV